MFLDAAGSMHDDGLSCPPAVFLEYDCLRNAASSLRENGILAMNLVARDGDVSKSAKTSVSAHFNTAVCHSNADEVNEVLLCANRSEIDAINFASLGSELKSANAKKKQEPWVKTMIGNLQSLKEVKI